MNKRRRYIAKRKRSIKRWRRQVSNAPFFYDVIDLLNKIVAAGGTIAEFTGPRY